MTIEEQCGRMFVFSFFEIRDNNCLQGGRGRCIGRFCCCAIMTIVFLIVSVVLSLALVWLFGCHVFFIDVLQWIRPPSIAIGQVTPIQKGGSTVRLLQNKSS